MCVAVFTRLFVFAAENAFERFVDAALEALLLLFDEMFELLFELALIWCAVVSALERSSFAFAAVLVRKLAFCELTLDGMIPRNLSRSELRAELSTDELTA